MTSKKNLRRRLIDICAGAGLFWNKEKRSFDGGSLSSYFLATYAIRKVFKLNPSWTWGSNKDIDILTDTVYDAIKKKNS